MLKKLLSVVALVAVMSLAFAPFANAQVDYDYDYDTTYDLTSTDTLTDEEAAAALAFGGTVMVVALVFGLVFYIYSSYALMVTLQKINVENAWLAFVPIANIYILFKASGLESKYALIFLAIVIPGLNIVVSLFMLYLYMKVIEKRGFNQYLGLLLLVPIANLILPGYIAWGTPSGATAATPAAPKSEAAPAETK